MTTVDAHYTPPGLWAAILKAYAPFMPGPIAWAWEPCEGGGACTAAMRDVFGCAVVGTDLDGSNSIADVKLPGDCTEMDVPDVDLIATNPPFTTKGNQYRYTMRVCWALVEASQRRGVPLLLLAPAAWHGGATGRYGWIRHGDKAATSRLIIGRRVWSGVREMCVYAWGIDAPALMPDITEWEDDPDWFDSTCGGGR